MSSGERISVTQAKNKQALHEILEDIENSSREESGYVIIDVCNPDEILTILANWQSVLKLFHCLLLHKQAHSICPRRILKRILVLQCQL
jgi:hypothetical protein